jgi:hypothetical protein
MIGHTFYNPFGKVNGINAFTAMNWQGGFEGLGGDFDNFNVE